MKDNISAILALVIAILLLFIFVQNSCTREDDTKTPATTISVPPREKVLELPDLSFKPITSTVKDKEYVYIPVPQKPDTTLLNAYRREIDSLKRELMYAEAVTKRTYESKYEDENLIAHFYAETTGTLDKLSMPYYKIKGLDIVVVPDKPDLDVPKFDILLGTELGIPFGEEGFAFKGNVFVQNKNMMYNLSYDTDKRAWVGLAIKL